MALKAIVQPIAVLEIGSSAIHMTIAQEGPAGREILEDITRTIPIFKDTLSQGVIARETIHECTDLLHGWKATTSQYGVDRIHAVVTAGVLGAGNIDSFLDKLETHLGIAVTPLHAQQEAGYVYRALLARGDMPPGNHAMIKIGAAASLLTLFSREVILAHRVLPLGLIQLRQIYDAHARGAGTFLDFLNSNLDHELGLLDRSQGWTPCGRLYAFGNEVEAIRPLLGTGPKQVPFSPEELANLNRKTADAGREKLTRLFGVPWELSEHFPSASHILSRIATFLDVPSIEISPVTLRDGLLETTRNVDHDSETHRFTRQLRHDSLSVGRSFQFDEPHAETVTRYSLELFDLTADRHHLGTRDRALLMAAALMHDVGYSISWSGHHKHSHYIIQARDFFFLSETEKQVIALAARYHRKAGPKAGHIEFHRLGRGARMKALKLAAFVRLGEALDYSRRSSIQRLDGVWEGDHLTLVATADSGLYGELWSFNDKKDLFEDLMGITVRIETVHSQRLPGPTPI